MQLNINGKNLEGEAMPDMPPLWALRDTRGRPGRNFGRVGAGDRPCSLPPPPEKVRKTLSA